jgi:hypothetical protein
MTRHKTKTQKVTYLEKGVIEIGSKIYFYSNFFVKKNIILIIKQQEIIMSKLSDLQAQLTAQDNALSAISTNVTGIQADVAALKQKIIDLSTNTEAAVSAALDQLAPLVNGIGTKIDAIGTTTAALDAETDPGNV